MDDSNKDVNPFLRLANEFRAIKSPVNYRIDPKVKQENMGQSEENNNDRIKSLEQDKAELRSEINALKESKRAAAELIYSLEARIAKLTEALKFYADPYNWRTRSGKIGVTPLTDGTDAEQIEGHWTCGKLAREALKEDV